MRTSSLAARVLRPLYMITLILVLTAFASPLQALEGIERYAAASPAEAFSLQASGDPTFLDPRFGTEGVFTFAGLSNRERDSVALQADGKILAATTGAKVLRFDESGALDATFGTGGMATTGVAGIPYDLVVQPDGKILMLAVSDSTPQETSLIRLNADGSLDPDFDTDGIVPLPSLVTGTGVDLQSDGKIVVLGISNAGTPEPFDNYDTELLRLNTDGSPDSTFGDAGSFVYNFLGDDWPSDLVIDSSDRIVFIDTAAQSIDPQNGVDQYDLVVARLTANGALDTDFNTTGIQQVDIGASANPQDIAVQPDGMIIAVGEGDHEFGGYGWFLVRVDTGGALDPSFGTGGIVYPAFELMGVSYALAMQPDGKVVVGGATEYTQDGVGVGRLTLARFNTDGTIDTGFGVDGLIMPPETNIYARVTTDLVIDSQGRFVVVGGTVADPVTYETDFVLARYLNTQTLTVNTTDDADDLTCDAAHCSLREAITAANATTGLDTIAFDIDGAGPHTIIIDPVLGPLPDITQPVSIDGTTEPDYAGTPIVELSGDLFRQPDNDISDSSYCVWEHEFVDGLAFRSSSNIIRGLAIYSFGDGLALYESDDNLIEDNYIGTDANQVVVSQECRESIWGVGIVVEGSSNNQFLNNLIAGDGTGQVIKGYGEGITVSGDSDNNIIQGNRIRSFAWGAAFDGAGLASGNVVGGTTADARNVIASHIGVGTAGTIGTVIQGNYIGTNETGTESADGSPAGQGGIFVDGSGLDLVPAVGTIIGGTEPGAGNLISGNTGFGIKIGTSSDTTVQGNLIGVDAGGVNALGNTGHGIIVVNDAVDVMIGGASASAANVIANSGGSGVLLDRYNNLDNLYPDTGYGITVQGNAIYANNGPGIDLDTDTAAEVGDAVTANDTGDADTGMNGLQNYPVLTPARLDGNTLTIEGTLNSTPSSTFTLDFYANTTCDASGHGEGERYLGSASVTTDANGNVSFNEALTGAAIGEFITATGTAADGSTSEFSQCVEVTAPPVSTTLVVNTTDDTGDGVCDESHCSLRDAITAANATPEQDAIEFDIAGTAPHVIQIDPVNGALPIITQPVIIDGTSEPDYVDKPVVEIDGSLLTDLPAAFLWEGLYTSGADGNVIRGLSIHSFLTQIHLTDSNSNVLEANFIGMQSDGTTAGPNPEGSVGLALSQSNDNLIGGVTPEVGNLFAGDQIGIYLEDANNNQIQGNLIGTDITGLTAVGGEGGIVFALHDHDPISSGNVIGGTTAGARNVISGHTGSGIYILQADNTTVQGNYIGLAADGVQSLGNGAHGIIVYNTVTNLLIGGTEPGAGNTIAYNAGEGILLDRNAELPYMGLPRTDIPDPGYGITIRGNRIFANTGYGIDLDGNTSIDPSSRDVGDGITANDTGDVDTGMNGLQNYPELTAAALNGETLTVEGTLNSTPSSTFTLDFYANTTCDASGHGEGERYLGSASVTTDANGNVSFNEALTGAAIGEFITATGTAADGSTSEFSECEEVTAPPVSTTLVVNTTDDPGDGVCDESHCSLREAITVANATVGVKETIAFDIDGAGPHTISVASVLPVISDPVIIDGTTEPDYGGTPMIELAGSLLPFTSGNHGLHFTAGDSTIRGLVINQFFIGVRVTSSSNNLVEDSYIGTDVTGAQARANYYGLWFESSDGNTIRRNVISGNQSSSMWISSVQGQSLYSDDNLIVGNVIGLNASGTAIIPSNQGGIYIQGSNNTIGGTTPEARNVISGNGHGLQIGSGSGNIIQGNYVGTDVTGTLDLGNRFTGIFVGGLNNLVGGTEPGARNIISGNQSGLGLNGTGHTVQGNYIGTDVTGSVDLGNDGNGIGITGSGHLIGGVTAGSGNIIAGNGQNGISLSASDTIIQGNLIGTDAAGLTTLPNSQSGILLGYSGSATGTLIGGAAPEARNVISGNTQYGIRIDSASTTTIQGNYIGTDSTGGTDLGNGIDGVWAASGTATLGGSESGAGNVISGNNRHGIYLSTAGNIVQGNLIGLNAAGDSPVGNAQSGLYITAANTRIGGTAAGEGNVISGNGAQGVYLSSAASSTTIQGNFIGTTADGTAAAGNYQYGIYVDATDQVTIGGEQPGARNIISGNGNSAGYLGGGGIRIVAPTSSNPAENTLIQGNYIGTDITGSNDLGNRFAIQITGYIVNTTIGGSSPEAMNVISGNLDGVNIQVNSAVNTMIKGNRIGTNASGTAALRNDFFGILLGASNVIIGGTGEGDGNLLSGNGGDGIRLVNGSSGNTILGNYIGTDVTGQYALGNENYGVQVWFAGGNNAIGTADTGNLISGNGFAGIYLIGSHYQTIQKNLIGVDASGTAILPNGGAGIISQDSNYVNIGGNGRNVISGNTTDGIQVSGGAGVNIERNAIGTDYEVGLDLGNGRHGIRVNASGTKIGDYWYNFIWYNGGSGVFVESGVDNFIFATNTYANAGPGIDLAPEGPTANDTGDADTGANNRQNYPVITSISRNVAANTTTVQGKLNSRPRTDYLITFYVTDECYPSGAGQWILDTMAVFTDGYGNATFNYTIPDTAVPMEYFVVATATAPNVAYNAWGSTSEFSVCATFYPLPSAVQLGSPSGLLNVNPASYSWTAQEGTLRYNFVLTKGTTTILNTEYRAEDICSGGVCTITPNLLLADGAYTWKVRGWNPKGYGAFGSKTFTVDTTPPPAPSLSAPALNAQVRGTPTFSWLAASGANWYRFEYDDDSDPDNGGLYTIEQSTLSHKPNPVMELGSYYWRVQARDAAGNWGAWSASRQVTIIPPIPAAPVLITATNIFTLDTSPELTWNAVPYAAQYEVQIDKSSTFTAPLDRSFVTGATAWIVDPALADGKYYWRVRAINERNEKGAWSSARYFTVDTTPPAPPSLGSPANNGKTADTTPALTWTAVTGAVKYNLEVSTNPDMSSPVVSAYDRPGTSFPVTTPLAYGVYYWRMQAIDAAGNVGTWSAIRKFYLTNMSAPLPDVWTTDTTPSFMWVSVSGATSYRLQISTDFSDFTAPIRERTQSTLTYTLPAQEALDHGIYYWRVQVYKGGVWLDMPAWKVIITPTPPGAPALTGPLSGLLTNTLPVTLTWTQPASGADRYEVQIDNDMYFKTPDVGGITGQGETSFTISSLPDGKWYWRVRALNTLGVPGAWTPSRYFTYDATPPAAPKLSAPANAATVRAIPTFSWLAVTGANAYRFQLDDDGDPENGALYSSAVLTTLSHKPTAMALGMYHWRVQARDAAQNWGPWSEDREITLKAAIPAAPTLVSPASGTTITTAPATFRWNPVTGADHYIIGVDTTATFAEPLVYTAEVEGTSATFSLPNGTSYSYWRVRAVNVHGEAGAWSSYRSVKFAVPQ